MAEEAANKESNISDILSELDSISAKLTSLDEKLGIEVKGYVNSNLDNTESDKILKDENNEKENIELMTTKVGFSQTSKEYILDFQKPNVSLSETINLDLMHLNRDALRKNYKRAN